MDSRSDNAPDTKPKGAASHAFERPELSRGDRRRHLAISISRKKLKEVASGTRARNGGVTSRGLACAGCALAVGPRSQKKKRSRSKRKHDGAGRLIKNSPAQAFTGLLERAIKIVFKGM